MKPSGARKVILPSWAALLAVNTIPIFGVLLAGWGMFPLVFLYWLENGVIGAMTVLKLLLLPTSKTWAKLLGAAFFVFHYGSFMGVHGVIILVLFAVLRPGGTEGPEAFTALLDQMVSPGILWAASALVASHGWSLVTHFLRGRERQTATIAGLMDAPYGRIVFLHLFIIAGTWAVLTLGSPTALMALFVAMKTAVDLWAHVREHRKAQARTDVSKE